jgi:hypothetical protein
MMKKNRTVCKRKTNTADGTVKKNTHTELKAKSIIFSILILNNINKIKTKNYHFLSYDPFGMSILLIHKIFVYSIDANASNTIATAIAPGSGVPFNVSDDK